MKRKANTPPCRLLALPDALILKIVVKSAASSPKAPFVWRSLCRHLRAVLSLVSDHVWKRCFIAAYGERIAFEATSEQLHPSLGTEQLHPSLGTEQLRSAVERGERSNPPEKWSWSGVALSPEKSGVALSPEKSGVALSTKQEIRGVALSPEQTGAALSPDEIGVALSPGLFSFPHEPPPTGEDQNRGRVLHPHACVGLTCVWALRYGERLVAGGNWKDGSGRERSVALNVITEAIIASEEIPEWTRDSLYVVLIHKMKLESNLLFLALDADTMTGPRVPGCPIVVWDLEKEAVQSICVGHEYTVQTLEAKRGASLLLSGGHCEIRVWDVASGGCLCYVSSLNEGPWGETGSLKSLHWVDVDGGVVRDWSRGENALVPKKRVVEELQEWRERTGTSRTRKGWPAISTPAGHAIPGAADQGIPGPLDQRNPRRADHAIPGPADQGIPNPAGVSGGAEYWGPEGQRDSSLNASQQNVLGCTPRDHILLGRKSLTLEQAGAPLHPNAGPSDEHPMQTLEQDGALHWVLISQCHDTLPGKVATVWSASPQEPTPLPIRRFKNALCFDKRTGAIALQGPSPPQIHVADVITGQELQTMSLSTRGNREKEAADIGSADFSHSDSLGWCLVLFLGSNLILVANVTTGQLLVRLQCGPHESFYLLSPLGRIFTLKCPWAWLRELDNLPPFRDFSLVDVETQTSSRFMDLGKRGQWVPMQVKNLVGGEPSATSIWMGPGNASILLWTGPGPDVGTLSLLSSTFHPHESESSSSRRARPAWCPDTDEIDTNWRWLAVLDYPAIRIWDFLLSDNSQGP